MTKIMLSSGAAFDGLPVKGSYVILVFGLVLVQYLWTRYRPHLRNAPGPVLASFSNFWKIGGVLSQDMPWRNIAAHEKYGSLVRIGPNHVSASDPEALKTIYGFTNIFRKVGMLSKGLRLLLDRYFEQNKTDLLFSVSFLHDRRRLISGQEAAYAVYDSEQRVPR